MGIRKTTSFTTARLPAASDSSSRRHLRFYSCPVCNKPMMRLNNDRIVETITRKIKQIKRELNE